MAIDFHLDDHMNVMRQYPDGYFDLALPDVQYGIGEDGRKSASRSRNIKREHNKFKTLVSSSHLPMNWDDSPPSQEYFDELFRVSKKRIIFGSNYLSFSQKSSSPGRIFWDKVNGNSDYSDGEILWTDCHTSTRLFRFMWNGMMQGKSISEGHIQRGDKSKNQRRIHPTEKPLEIYLWLLSQYAKPGYKVLDTHGGSLIHAVAASRLGIDLTICEINPYYFHPGKRRYDLMTAQANLFK